MVISLAPSKALAVTNLLWHFTTLFLPKLL